MRPLLEFWNRIDTRQRVIAVGGAAALVLVLGMLVRLASQPSYELLYSGLEPAAAGEVIAAIETRGIPHRVQGDAIFVRGSDRDALRLSLAGDGLPANGVAGYELLDTLSGFGTTSQMFDAAYWRAKEGELARTITGSPRIRAARVHIANPSTDPFQPTQTVTASVALQPAAGGLAPGHAQALRYLVASSVQGLLPENVTVIDADSGQVLGGAELATPGADALGRADALRRNIERLLAARVGPGNAVVQVSVEMNTARETILERRIDPDSRVVVQMDTEERSDTAEGRDGAGVTVASNLPDGDAGAGGGTSSSQESETRERITYDMSETQREIEQGPGDIRRISVAVLLNGVPQVSADGVSAMVPRDAAELDALRELVERAVGFDAARGDAVSVQSMVFDETAGADLVPAGLTDRMSFDLGRVVQTVVLAAAALFIAFGLLRPLLTGSRAEDAAPPDAAVAPAMRLGEVTPPALPGDANEGTGTAESADATAGALALPGQDPADPLPVDPVERLRRLIEDREEETVEILRGWMDADEEPQL